MIQTATVRKLENNMAQLQVRRKTACGHDCDRCSGCTQVITGETLVTVRNELNAGPGDTVLIESHSGQVLGMAAIVYLLPFALFFVGYFLGASFFAGAIPVIAGLLGFALGIAIAVLRDRHEKRVRSLSFRMVEIKKRCLDT